MRTDGTFLLTRFPFVCRDVQRWTYSIAESGKPSGVWSRQDIIRYLDLTFWV
jgi:hypothetical protein